MTLPLRLMILHFSHMGFTDGLTFILLTSIRERCLSFTSPRDPAAGQVVRAHLHRNLVTRQDLDKVHPELAGNVCQNGMPVSNVNGEHCIRQRIDYDALKLDYVVFCQDLLTPLVLTVELLTKRGQIPS